MLANVIHTPSTIEYLEYNPEIATKVLLKSKIINQRSWTAY
jgi:hypothetical protein